MKLSINKKKKTTLFLSLAIGLVIVVVGTFLAIRSYRTRNARKVDPFIPRSTQDICSIDTDISRDEFIRKLSDSIFGEDYNDPDFIKNPVEFYTMSNLKFTNGEIKGYIPMYSFGYMYEMIQAAYLAGIYHDHDIRYLQIYSFASDFLYANTVQFTSQPRDLNELYLMMNPDSACNPLKYPQGLDEYTYDIFKKMCTDLYFGEFAKERHYPGSPCPVAYSDVSFLTDLGDMLHTPSNEMDFGILERDHGILSDSNYQGSSIDFLILYSYNLEKLNATCYRDAYFKSIGDSLIWMLENFDADRGEHNKQDIMKLLNTISYGLSSGLLSDQDEVVLRELRNDLFEELHASHYYYDQYTPYGMVEISYIEICMRDKDFFAELGEGEYIHYLYDTSCEFEKILIDSMVERSCEINNGDKLFLYSYPFIDSDGDKIAYTSIPYSSRLLANLISLSLSENVEE
jgi:hypothetical protein